MDRRCEPRVAVQLPVDVWRDGRLLGRFTCDDLSRGGVGLATGTARLPVRALVQVVIAVDGESYRIPALMQNFTPGRAGLLFADDADVLWGVLLERQQLLAAA